LLVVASVTVTLKPLTEAVSTGVRFVYSVFGVTPVSVLVAVEFAVISFTVKVTV